MFACRDRSRPSGVFGPVECPPWSLQRDRLRIAGAMQAVPRLVLAPQRGAVLGSPGEFPFLNQLPRGSWGRSPVFFVILPPTHLRFDAADNRLPAMVHGNVLNGHFLLALASIAIQRLQLIHECAH